MRERATGPREPACEQLRRHPIDHLGHLVRGAFGTGSRERRLDAAAVVHRRGDAQAAANFDEDVKAFARELSHRSASALRLIKGLVYGIEGSSFEDDVRYGAEVNVEARATPDCQTGVRRFLESRKKP